MSETVVSLAGVGKRFVKYEDRPTLVEGITKALKRHRRGRIWAVRHVDLEVEAGEAVGVIGRNGSGKSTLLSMLAGVTSPTEGVVTVRGRLAPLLSLGVGFDPELTGRENVYINGTILGMTRREIDRRFDAIVSFAEMGEFIDTPVKFYSSGMLVRLGFSVAISAEPDILIVDEVLSVGDVGFQQRSFGRMMELQANGTTVLVVSHNVSAIQRVAPRTMVLHDGAVRFLGPTVDAIDVYYDALKLADEEESGEEGNAVRLTPVELFGPDGAPTAVVESHDEVTLTATVRFQTVVERPGFWFAVRDSGGLLLFAERSTSLADREIVPGSEFVLSMRLPMRLVAGTYTAVGGVAWGSPPNVQRVSHRKNFYVAGRAMAQGLVDLAPTVTVDGREVDRSELRS